MNIPPLKRSGRSQEYKQYGFKEKSRIVSEWLFNTEGNSHRQLDRDVLGMDPEYSRGYQSMGVLHFLGLKKEFKGIFQGRDRFEVIGELKKHRGFAQIIQHLEYEEEDNDFILSQELIALGKLKDENFEAHYENWLREVEVPYFNPGTGHPRKEQAILRALLFKNYEDAGCALCHKVLPTEIMVAAHIKPRNECSILERKDPNIVMPACRIGCDDLFEKGYLLVGNDGGVRINENKKHLPHLTSFMLQYQGRICTYFNQGTRKYFEYKRESLVIHI